MRDEEPAAAELGLGRRAGLLGGLWRACGLREHRYGLPEGALRLLSLARQPASARPALQPARAQRLRPGRQARVQPAAGGVGACGDKRRGVRLRRKQCKGFERWLRMRISTRGKACHIPLEQSALARLSSALHTMSEGRTREKRQAMSQETGAVTDPLP